MTDLKLRDILPHLEKVRPSGEGYTSLCPSHEDHKNSLSVKEDPSGKTLLYCHAGCSFQNVITALNVPTNGNGYKQQKQIESTYDYTDENGNLLFQTIRYKPKDFRQRRPDGNGGWAWNLKDTPLALYRLPEILASPLVYLVEGEEDVETLLRHKLPATCAPMGAGKWRNEYNKFLSDKTVVILPDNDQPGRGHADKVASSLYGTAREILLINLPGLPEKGDVTDFFQNGGTADDLIGLIERAESWNPSPATVTNSQTKSKFVFTPLTELLNEPEEETSFLWDNTLPFGGFSICSAKPKVGKSTLARNLAVKIVQGESFLDRATVKGKVLYLCLEEKRAEVAKHFRAMGAKSEDILIHTDSTPENAVEELALAIAEFEPVLVVIDPLSRVLRVKDFNDYGGMSRGLEPFIDLARKMNTHISALHHDSKMERSGGDALLGSTALFGAVDCHIQLKKSDKGRTISTTQRYGEDIPETIIELDKDSGIITSKGDLQSFVIDNAKDAILRILNPNEEVTEQQIKERIEGYQQGIISRALRELVDEERLKRKGEGRKGNPYLYSKK